MDQQAYLTLSQRNSELANHKTNHCLHILLCLLTLGIWLPCWILVTKANANDRAVINKVYDQYNY